MANHASAVKAARQSLKRAARNQQIRSQCRTAMKKLRLALAQGKKANKEELVGMLSSVQRTLFKAASKNVLKRETASRYVSRLSTAVSQVTGA